MSHKIMGQRVLSRSKPMWHGLGTIMPADENITASEAMARTAGDLEVKTVPVSCEIDGVQTPISNHQAVVRMPTADTPKAEVFGIVGKDWKAESYVDLARGLDKLSEKYKVETAGVLENGKLAFLSMRGEDWDVVGDEMQSYFIANLSLKPRTGHRIIHSPVRVVCWNTNTAAKDQASISLSIPHNADAKQQLGIAGTLIEKFHQAQAKTKETCEAFAKRTVTVEEADRIFKAAFPDPTMPRKIQQLRDAVGGDEAFTVFTKNLDPNAMAEIATAQARFEQLMEKRIALREEARTRYTGFSPSHLGGTAWAAYNAVTEVADWREGKAPGMSTVWGPRAGEKSRAFAEALSIVSN